MASYTPYLNLEMPTVNEKFDILKQNQNMQNIDNGYASLDEKIIYVDKNLPAYSYEAGTPGTYGTGVSIDITKPGYRPIAITLKGDAHPGAGTKIPMIKTDTECEVHIIRAVNAEISISANDAMIRVAYIKT